MRKRSCWLTDFKLNGQFGRRYLANDGCIEEHWGWSASGPGPTGLNRSMDARSCQSLSARCGHSRTRMVASGQAVREKFLIALDFVGAASIAIGTGRFTLLGQSPPSAGSCQYRHRTVRSRH